MAEINKTLRFRTLVAGGLIFSVLLINTLIVLPADTTVAVILAIFARFSYWYNMRNPEPLRSSGALFLILKILENAAIALCWLGGMGIAFAVLGKIDGYQIPLWLHLNRTLVYLWLGAILMGSAVGPLFFEKSEEEIEEEHLNLDDNPLRGDIRQPQPNTNDEDLV